MLIKIFSENILRVCITVCSEIPLSSRSPQQPRTSWIFGSARKILLSISNTNIVFNIKYKYCYQYQIQILLPISNTNIVCNINTNIVININNIYIVKIWNTEGNSAPQTNVKPWSEIMPIADALKVKQFPPNSWLTLPWC